MFYKVITYTYSLCPPHKNYNDSYLEGLMND